MDWEDALRHVLLVSREGSLLHPLLAELESKVAQYDDAVQILPAPRPREVAQEVNLSEYGYAWDVIGPSDEAPAWRAFVGARESAIRAREARARAALNDVVDAVRLSQKHRARGTPMFVRLADAARAEAFALWKQQFSLGLIADAKYAEPSLEFESMVLREEEKRRFEGSERLHTIG
jgi:hypothetical protein